MLGPALKFTAKYKKYRAACGNCTAKDAKTLRDRVKYFRHDAVVALGAIEEEVPGQNLKEFSKDRKVAGLWKEVNWAYERQLGAWNELEELVKRAAEFEKNLKKLEGEIDKELKQQGKGAKPDKDIQKLQKQIEDDLKEMKVIQVKFKKAAPCDKNLEKEFAKEIKYVESADPSATKFGKATAKYFEKGILQKATDKCKTAMKKATTEAGLAVAAAKKGSAKEAEVNLKACGLEIQKILKFEKVYSKLKTTFKKDISESDDKKRIQDAITQFEKFKEDAGKLFANAAAEVKKVSK